MSDQFLAEIRAFPLNFTPVGWMPCNGQLLPIAQYTALFSLLGTNFGGDGRSNFGLPNLQGAVPVHQGEGAGLSFYAVGQTGGSTAVALTPQENALHSHALVADKESATTASPAGAMYMKGEYASTASGVVFAYTTKAPNTPMNAAAIASQGGGQPHNNMMPYLSFNFCIAVTGIFPTRS